MQEPWHEPSDRSGDPLVGEKQRLQRSDHESLGQDAVNHRYAASDDPAIPKAASCQFMTIHLCMEHMLDDLAGVNTLVYGEANE
jgi:hypothetical protein